MCVLLDLFSGAVAPAFAPDGASGVSEPIQVMTESEFGAACHRQGLDPICELLNPCYFCSFNDICDEDECGALCFDVDGEENNMSWSDWLYSDKY